MSDRDQRVVLPVEELQKGHRIKMRNRPCVVEFTPHHCVGIDRDHVVVYTVIRLDSDLRSGQRNGNECAKSLKPIVMPRGSLVTLHPFYTAVRFHRGLIQP